MTSRFSKFTSVLLTPSTFESACVTVIGQAAHVIPGTDRVTVWVAAHTGSITAAARAREANSLFIVNSRLVEERHDVRKAERNQNQHGDNPKNQLVGGVYPRNRAHFARLASRGGSVDAPIGEVQRQQCHADEDWAIRFKFGQVADPCAAKAEREQRERPETARRGQDCRDAASGERAFDVRVLCHHLRLLLRIPNLAQPYYRSQVRSQDGHPIYHRRTRPAGRRQRRHYALRSAPRPA